VAADWLPVVAVAVVSQAAIGLEQAWAGSDLDLAATSLLLSLPLALRRRYPLGTDALLAVALVTQMALGGSLHFGSFVAVLVAAHATGRHLERWPVSTLGGAVLLAGAVGANARSAIDHPDEIFFPVFYVAAAVGSGRLVRRFAKQADDLRAANAALARERHTTERLAIATERIRLARELHDVVAHLLTVMVVQAEAGEASLEQDPEAARRALRRIQSTGRDGLGEIRSMVRVLRSSDEDPPSLGIADLDTLAAVLGEAGLEVRIHRDDDLDRLDPGLAAQLFRIVQEALTNTIKHSAASTAAVRVSCGPHEVRLEIRDPGPSLGNTGTGGHGIHGMAERLAAYAGTVEAGPSGEGFAVVVRVPTAAAPAHDLVGR